MKITTKNTIEQKEFVSKDKYDKLLSDYEYLKQQLTDLKRMIFGSKSERFIPTDEAQLHLFDSPEEETREKEIEEITELLEYNPARYLYERL